MSKLQPTTAWYRVEFYCIAPPYIVRRAVVSLMKWGVGGFRISKVTQGERDGVK